MTKNIKILSIDLGINNPAACTIMTSKQNGKYTKIKQCVIGKICNQERYEQIKKAEKNIEDFFENLETIKEKLDNENIPYRSEECLKLLEKPSLKFKEIKKEIIRLGRYKLYPNIEVSQEELLYIFLFKNTSTWPPNGPTI